MTDSAAEQRARRTADAPEERKWRQWAHAAQRLGARALRQGAQAAERGRQAGFGLIRNMSPTRLSAFSQLSQRIFALAIIALGVQIAGVFYTNKYRDGLIELRLEALKTEASIIAVTIAEAAASTSEPGALDRVVANEVLRRLALQTKLRAQIFDSSGRLSGDTRSLLSSTIIVEQDVEPRKDEDRGALGLVEKSIRYVAASFTKQLPLYRETPPAGISLEAEVYEALAGKIGKAKRGEQRR